MEMMHKNVELNQKVITFEEFKLSNALKRQIISALSLSLSVVFPSMVKLKETECLRVSKLYQHFMTEI